MVTGIPEPGSTIRPAVISGVASKRLKSLRKAKKRTAKRTNNSREVLHKAKPIEAELRDARSQAELGNEVLYARDDREKNPDLVHSDADSGFLDGGRRQ